MTRLADRWAAIAAPAVVFWGGAVLTGVLAAGGPRRLAELSDWLEGLGDALQLGVAVGGLCVVVASVIVVSRLTTPALRLLEGYWPGCLSRIRSKLIDRAHARLEKTELSWQELLAKRRTDGDLSSDDQDALAVLELRLHRFPSDPSRLMPTRVGNILRAVESQPRDKYGLDGVSTWPRLWLVLPDSTRHELVAARQALNSAVGATLWSTLFAVLIPSTLLFVGLSNRWPAGVLLVVCALSASAAGCVAYTAIRWWMPARAEAFGYLVESAYDLYRLALYEQLRWPLPTDPRQEREAGREITEYLWRGSDNPAPRFTRYRAELIGEQPDA